MVLDIYGLYLWLNPRGRAEETKGLTIKNLDF